MVCEKLDPQLLFCADNPGVRCVDVPFGKCKPKLVDSFSKDKKEAVS